MKHGMSKTRFYKIWGGMMDRCRRKKNPYYKNYGGRGIIVCERWLKFENFRDDMLKSYQKHFEEFGKDTTLERIDNNGNYCKENCHWVTWREQQQNTRRNINIIFKGRTQTLIQWSRELKINYQTLYNRLFRFNMPIEKAFKKVYYRKVNNLTKIDND